MLHYKKLRYVFWKKLGVTLGPININQLYIWVNYNDLTATSPESWLVRGMIPKWPWFMLVNYCNLPRYIYPMITLYQIYYRNSHPPKDRKFLIIANLMMIYFISLGVVTRLLYIYTYNRFITYDIRPKKLYIYQWLDYIQWFKYIP